MNALPEAVADLSLIRVYGKVRRIVGLVVEGHCPRSSIGSLCEITPLEGGPLVPAEIVGYNNDQALLMPLGELRGLGPGSLIRVRKESASIKVGEQLLGRVIDGMECPLDDGPALHLQQEMPLYGLPPGPMQRRTISEPIDLGIRAIKACSPAASASGWGSWPAPGWAKACSWA